MTRSKFLLAAGVTAVAFAQAPKQAPPKTHLKVGDMAPDFTLPSTMDKPVKLSDYRGKKNVVLAFFPAAFTGGCTSEMKSYHASIQKFQDMGAEVFSISTDNTPSLKRFAQETSGSFAMLSDFAKRSVSKDYGVLMENAGIANRATFVVDQEGKITFIQEGKEAVDISGAETACSRIKK